MYALHQGLTLQSSKAVNNAKRLGWPLKELGGDVYMTQAPGGYPFYLVDKEHPSTGEPQGCHKCCFFPAYKVKNMANISDSCINANRSWLVHNQ